ncbi:hypothetical protein FRC10_012015 [Ceratobasidium sp. 414]|nr:hypothetical protein FRC10_012015 [Ceratobasidium sp. 414]
MPGLEAFQQLASIAEKAELPYESVSVKRDNIVYATTAPLVERATIFGNLQSECDNDIANEHKLVLYTQNHCNCLRHHGVTELLEDIHGRRSDLFISFSTYQLTNFLMVHVNRGIMNTNDGKNIELMPTSTDIKDFASLRMQTSKFIAGIEALNKLRRGE